ncbi:hypothetical protein [Roseibium sp. LAB1]
MDFKQSHEAENPCEARAGAEFHQQALQRHVRHAFAQPVACALDVEPGLALHGDLVGIGHALSVDRGQVAGWRARRFRIKRLREETAKGAVLARKCQRRYITRVGSRQGHQQVRAQTRHAAVLHDDALTVAPGLEQELRFVSRQSVFDQREG